MPRTKTKVRYWLGKKRPDIGAKISAKLRGRKLPEEYVAKQMNRLREQAKNARRNITKESQKRGGQKRRGRKMPLEVRKKISLSMKGEKSYLWKGGISSVNKKVRGSMEYREWRKSVFEIDNYTCKKCKQKGGKLEADHILPFAYFPATQEGFLIT